MVSYNNPHTKSEGAIKAPQGAKQILNRCRVHAVGQAVPVLMLIFVCCARDRVDTLIEPCSHRDDLSSWGSHPRLEARHK
jgi:hypothetical protein